LKFRRLKQVAQDILLANLLTAGFAAAYLKAQRNEKCGVQ
jgi:hypothetical protein